MRRREGNIFDPRARRAFALSALFFLAAWPFKEADASASAGDPRVRVPDAQKTIAQKMPEFRRCFERMHASGQVALDMTIVSDGAVSRARAKGAVPRDVSRCIESRALRTVFSEPEGGRTARLLVPVAYIRQRG